MTINIVDENGWVTATTPNGNKYNIVTVSDSEYYATALKPNGLTRKNKTVKFDSKASLRAYLTIN